MDSVFYKAGADIAKDQPVFLQETPDSNVHVLPAVAEYFPPGERVVVVGQAKNHAKAGGTVEVVEVPVPKAEAKPSVLDWHDPPEEGWTVRTLVKALLDHEVDTPVYILTHSDFGLSNNFHAVFTPKGALREDSPDEPVAGPLIVLD